MDTKLKKFLDENKIKYEVAEHKKVYTAFNEAETLALKVTEVAKAVLVKAGNNFAMVVVPATKYVDFGKVQKALSARDARLPVGQGSAFGGKAKKVSMAKESDIAKILKTKIGLIHPFGNLYRLPVLLDNALLKPKKLVMSAGSYTESLELRPKDFEKAVQPLKGSFSK